MILTIDHGFNASTFTGRVVASTGADLVDVVCAALGALSGPLHGGAPGPGARRPRRDRRPVARGRLRTAARSLPGAGSWASATRCIATSDPRSALLREIAEGLGGELVERAIAVEAEVLTTLAELKPDRPLPSNVEYYAGRRDGHRRPPTLDVHADVRGQPHRRVGRPRGRAGGGRQDHPPVVEIRRPGGRPPGVNRARSGAGGFATVDASWSERFGCCACSRGMTSAATCSASTTALLDDDEMQRLASTLGYSETVFLGAAVDGVTPTRIFTPTFEMPFAGHPLVGTTWHLTEPGRNGLAPMRDRRRHRPAGRRRRRQHRCRVPRRRSTRCRPPAGVAGAWIAHMPLPYEVHQLANPDAVAAYAPPDEPDHRLVWAPGDDGSDDVVRARFFAFGVGVPEDPGDRQRGGRARRGAATSRTDRGRASRSTRAARWAARRAST